VFARAFKGITLPKKKMNHVLSLLLHNLND
jgi:hypothetical protein